MKLILDFPDRYKVIGEIERYEEGEYSWTFWLKGHEFPAVSPSSIIKIEENGDIVMVHR